MNKSIFRMLFVLITLILSFFFFSTSMVLIKMLVIDRNSIIKDGGILIGLQHESNPISLDDSQITINSFSQIYNSLNELKYDYYELYAQPLNCASSQKIFFNMAQQTYQMNTSQAECIQISENIQKTFNISVIYGRLLGETDFTQIKTIPVLMGINYKDKYKLGDSFSAEYLFSPFTFKIVGFLNKGCCISIANIYYNLDNCIIMPSFNVTVTPTTKQEYVTMKIHLANKTSGKIFVSEEQFCEAYSDISKIISSSTVGEYSVYASTLTSLMKVKGIDLERLAIVSFFCSIICLSLVLYVISNIIRIGKKNYSIYKRAAFAILLSILSLYISCLLLAQALDYFLGYYYRITILDIIFPLISCALFLLLTKNRMQGNSL